MKLANLIKIQTLLLLLPFALAGPKSNSTTSTSTKKDIFFGANDCINACFQAFPTFFYCTNSTTTGYCCPDNSRTECQENPTQGVYCSSGANLALLTKYSFCPRDLYACETSGPVLYPLLNQNQTLIVKNKMTSSPMTVCYWELRINATSFFANHPQVPNASVFINVYMNSIKNLTVFMFQGDDRKTANNLTAQVFQGKLYSFPLIQGGSVFIVSYPNHTLSYNENNILSLQYHYSTNYYTAEGINAIYLPDMTPPGFYHFVISGFTISIAAVIGILMLLCYKDFDPQTKFEKRRHLMAKAARKQLQEELQRKVESKGSIFEDKDPNQEEDDQYDLDASQNTKSKIKQIKSQLSQNRNPIRQIKNNFVNQDDDGPQSNNNTGEGVGVHEVELGIMNTRTRSIERKGDNYNMKGMSPIAPRKGDTSQIGTADISRQISHKSYLIEPNYESVSGGEGTPQKSPQMIEPRQKSRAPELVSFGVQPQPSKPVYFVPRKPGPSSNTSKEDVKFNVLPRPKRREAKQVQKQVRKQDESNPFEDYI